jgi:transcriptional regulator with XRE-family HTH domain
MDGVDRPGFARVLVAARSRLTPSDVGLPAGLRRRVVGLRREEVAQLANLSVDYLVRLEQARGPNPSGAVLVALARALRLTDDERDHLFHLAGTAPPEPRESERTAAESVASLKAVAAKYPNDPGVGRLVAELLAGSAIFARLWHDERVADALGLLRVVGLQSMAADGARGGAAVADGSRQP